MKSLDEITADLEQALKPSRFLHALGVSATAAVMAETFGDDPKRAALAGLLHDGARRWSRDEQWRRLVRWDLPRHPSAEDYPGTWHAPLGAEDARRRYGVTDEAVLQAIRDHTIGRPAMSRLSRIVYIADAIDPTRDYQGVDRLRRLAHRDLDRALTACLEQTQDSLEARGITPHPDALRACAFYGVAMRRFDTSGLNTD